MRATTRLEDGTRTWAVLSDDGAYRYRLGRRWQTSGPCDVWIMLNPSTADAELDDPTIRRCIGFSRRGGAAGLVVVNLYALRATNPAVLSSHPDPIGPENDHHLREAVLRAWTDGGQIICAWGAHPLAASRALDLAEALDGMEALCLGLTKSGAPRHPLYVRGDVQPAAWMPR